VTKITLARDRVNRSVRDLAGTPPAFQVRLRQCMSHWIRLM